MQKKTWKMWKTWKNPQSRKHDLKTDRAASCRPVLKGVAYENQ